MVPESPPPSEQRTSRSSRKDTAMAQKQGVAWLMALLRAKSGFLLVHEQKVGPAVFLMLRLQFHLQGGQYLQHIFPQKLSRAPGPFLALLLHRFLFSSWEEPFCCSSSPTTSTSSMMSCTSSWNPCPIPATSSSTRGSLSSTISNLKRVASWPGMTTGGSKVPATQSIRMAGRRPQRPDHWGLQLR